ncbi:7765_t:CDS:1 [Scutellospora calospora]|uniref:7765_t:CDS:1 n=1 Tax=Scutellospora calospora TaxID=85575 RepID=A0ACA9MYQ5_9GLOM|nr:7765_t:CDS:1 [Scutellospora calospora]
MPFTKEQYQAYYQAHKEKLNQKRTERRKLTRLRQINQSRVETPSLSQVETGLRQFKLSEVETNQLENIRLGQVETLKKVNSEVETQKKVETAREMSQPIEKVETGKQVEPIKL